MAHSNQAKRIDKALTALVLDEPFFATLALKLAIVESTDIPTFCTDGKSLLYNPEFCATLKDGEIKTLLTHEVLHCALGHLWRLPNEADKETWNIATDNEVNHTLEESNILANERGQTTPFPFPDKDNICLSPEFRGMAAEKIYGELNKKKQNQKQPNSTSNKQGKGKPQAPTHGNGKCDCFKPINDKAKASQLKTEWEKAIIQAANVTKKKGKLPAQFERLVASLVSPAVDWKAVLRDFLREFSTNDYSFARSNPRFVDSGFYMPVLHSESAGNVVFVIDTSGSIPDETVKEFLTEAQSCLDELTPSQLTVMSCDAHIQTNDNYTVGDTIKHNLQGGGGTSFIPVFDYYAKANETPDVLVYLTDLQGSFPTTTPDFPVVWIVKSRDATEKVPFGHVVEIAE